MVPMDISGEFRHYHRADVGDHSEVKASSSQSPARRDFLRRVSVAAGLLVPTAALSAHSLRQGAFIQSPSQINILTTGADPTGYGDSAPAINLAAQQLPASGGSLLIPAGIYRVNSPIMLPSKAIAIIGDGSNVTIILVRHNGIVFGFVPQSTSATFCMRGIGFCPVGSGGGRPASAIVVNMPSGAVFNNPSVIIEDVDFSSLILPSQGFLNALSLANIWRSVIRNISHNGPGSSVIGSTFLTLSGFSIDNKFENCIVNQVDVGFLIGSYTEGLHLINPIVAGCNQAVVVGPRIAGSTANNALAIYISNGELACYNTSIQFSQQWGGWISGTHIGSQSGPAMLLYGVVELQVQNCAFSGSGSTVGIQLEVTQTAGCAANIFDSCVFTNIGTPIIFGPQTGNNTVENLRCIGQSNFPLLDPGQIVQDLSGNQTNNVGWLTGLTGPNRMQYLY